jgi:hypothetical protein
MLETNYLKWTLPNWITVVLMVSIAYVAYGFASQGIKQITAPSS